VQSGDHTAVRAVARLEANLVTLVSPVSFAGEVRVAPYTTRNIDTASDWYTYFPANVEVGQRHRIRPQAVNGETLATNLDDRVIVLTEDATERFTVTLVNPDGSLDLSDSVPGNSPEVRVAKIGEGDPLSDWDTRLLDDYLAADWVRYVTDPWGMALQAPSEEGFGKFVVSTGRSLFSSRAWSLFFPPGWYFWDNMIAQLANDGVLSQIEQDASEESGNLYTPLSKMPIKPEYVGDIGRFWHFPILDNHWASINEDSTLQKGQGNSPGTHHRTTPRLIPDFVSTAAAPAPPNGAVEAPASTDAHGDALPDVFVVKNSTDPRDVTINVPRSFIASARGEIPTEPGIERCTGLYVAFTRPGKHRLTVANSPRDLAVPLEFDLPHNYATKAAAAQEAHRWRFLPPVRLFSDPEMQTIRFDVEVKPVTVRAGGREHADGTTIELVLTQRLPFKVEPDGARRYNLTLLRPKEGEVLRADDATTLRARTRTGREQIELSRVYRYNAASKQFDDRVLNQHGVHLPHDIYIPIRRFTVSVVDTIPFRKQLSLDDADRLPAATPAHPGDALFLLVPAAVLRPPELQKPIVYNPTAVLPPAFTDVVPQITVPADLPAAVKAFVAPDGQALKVLFPVDTPPEENATLVFKINVGVPGNSGVLTATLALQPHFVIRRAVGAGFDFAPGDTADMHCVDPGGASVAIDAPVITPSVGVTAALTGVNSFKITVAGDAPKRDYQVLVTRKNEPEQKALRTLHVH
jgi:hypothetical protein